ncbi:hypothetical protein [Kibdelosporangium aridum]|uniref:Uncharacterized protein n=1 Tax=Kibdelosporangium aridum TaxID=2030 RepID=A0A1W2G0A4_KIBAR|nr:hypothetical protein [Kibdelosporangium aridum]SMD27422.1 hypothetical protein SAMN05661093_11029 [Kibdelosporangium aridum]
MATDANVLWGTNPDTSVFYAARVHVVSAHYPWSALCGLPVELIWEQRPVTSQRLCPECCLLAVEWFFPTTNDPFLVHDFSIEASTVQLSPRPP